MSSIPERSPALQVFFERDEIRGRLVRDTDLDDSIWTRVVQMAREYDADVVVRDNEILLHWAAAAATLKDISALRRSYGFTIAPDAAAEEMLRRAKSERIIVREARARADNAPVPGDAADIERELVAKGWDTTKRRLKDFQAEDLLALRQLRHGANFSVPGSGKTTVSLALHLLTGNEDTHLLVVCPKNAIDAWMTVISECMREDAPDENGATFARLDGEASEIRRLLRSGHKRFVITYDRAIRIPALLREYLSTRPVHMILDESHRIKAGALSRRGQLLGQLAPLPVRRDILTGTPLPNSLRDLGPQIDFLWPGLGLSRQIEERDTARDIIRNLYVRTTKRRLGLPERRIKFENIEMGPAQTGLYAALKSPIIRQLQSIRNTRRITTSARNNVMRLLEASSNPVLAVRAMGASFAPIIDPSDHLSNAVLEEGDSNKILRACEIARELAREGRKSVIWALFHENVDRLMFLLEDLGSTHIDGRVPTGDSSDPRTREGRIADFQKGDGPMVLIANPAACSEGINLHHSCHDAIYLERSYNAAHYLQSLDRIHRLGLEAGVITRVTILQSIAPARIGSIDHSVGKRMHAKLERMHKALDDPDLHQLMLDEESADEPVAFDVSLEDLTDLLEQLTTGRLLDEADME